MALSELMQRQLDHTPNCVYPDWRLLDGEDDEILWITGLNDRVYLLFGCSRPPQFFQDLGIQLDMHQVMLLRWYPERANTYEIILHYEAKDRADVERTIAEFQRDLLVHLAQHAL